MNKRVPNQNTTRETPMSSPSSPRVLGCTHFFQSTALTLGFFTLLPLGGTSSENLLFLCLLSTEASATPPSSGIGAAFSPRGSDYKSPNNSTRQAHPLPPQHPKRRQKTLNFPLHCSQLPRGCKQGHH